LINNLETIDLNDFQKLEDIVAPTMCNMMCGIINNYTANITNMLACVSNTTSMLPSGSHITINISSCK